jgi:hypothetical protein
MYCVFPPFHAGVHWASMYIFLILFNSIVISSSTSGWIVAPVDRVTSTGSSITNSTAGKPGMDVKKNTNFLYATEDKFWTSELYLSALFPEFKSECTFDGNFDSYFGSNPSWCFTSLAVLFISSLRQIRTTIPWQLISWSIKCSKETQWPKPLSELYRPSNRSLSAKLVPTFLDRECRVVSALNSHSRILGFLDC